LLLAQQELQDLGVSQEEIDLMLPLNLLTINLNNYFCNSKTDYIDNYGNYLYKYYYHNPG